MTGFSLGDPAGRMVAQRRPAGESRGEWRRLGVWIMASDVIKTSATPPNLTDQQVLDFYSAIAGPVWRIIQCVLAHPRLFGTRPGDDTLERAATFLEALAAHDKGKSDGKA